MNLFYLWVVSKTLLCGCSPDKKRYDFDKVRSKYTIDKIAALPAQVSESSGLAAASDSSSFWTHNDSGSAPELYRVGRDGSLKETRRIGGAQNRDWEDLARDEAGRLFIGDLGNNSSSRRDLSVYILPANWETDPGESRVEKITLRYGRQTHFSGEKKFRKFDCEAFFYRNDSLYLFSKNTGKKPRYTMLYKIPAKAGDYTLFPADSIRLNETITGADISRDGKQFALLSYGKIFFFDAGYGGIDFSRPVFCLKKYKGQTEAIMYTDFGSVLITNEKGEVFELLPR